MDEFEMEQMHYEIDAMRAENEGLRAAYAALRQASADLCVVCGWRFFVPGEGCQGCLVEQMRTDTKRYVAEERAAVVAWLREEYDTHSTQDAADHIERGEHRREEER